jgi:hypothetical protein
MTMYFDDFQEKLSDIDPEDFRLLIDIENDLVMDCTICAQMPGFPSDLKVRIHKIVLKYGIHNLPLNAPPRDFEFSWEHMDLLRSMGSDLHSVFHDVARLELDRFSDSPKMPLMALYTDGEIVREQMIEREKEEGAKK